MATQENIKLLTDHKLARFSMLTGAASHIPNADFVERAHDFARGIEVALELVHASNLADADDSEALLDHNQREALLRFAAVAADALVNDAERRIDRMTDQTYPGGRFTSMIDGAAAGSAGTK